MKCISQKLKKQFNKYWTTTDYVAYLLINQLHWNWNVRKESSQNTWVQTWKNQFNKNWTTTQCFAYLRIIQLYWNWTVRKENSKIHESKLERTNSIKIEKNHNIFDAYNKNKQTVDIITTSDQTIKSINILKSQNTWCCRPLVAAVTPPS